MPGFGAQYQRWYGEVKPPAARVPEMDGFRRAVIGNVQQFDTSSEVCQGPSRVLGVEFCIERSRIMRRETLWTNSIGKDGEKVRLSGEASCQLRPVGEDMPTAGLRLMLPMAAVGVSWDIFTEAA
jgi:hypothetical protein